MRQPCGGAKPLPSGDRRGTVEDAVSAMIGQKMARFRRQDYTNLPHSDAELGRLPGRIWRRWRRTRTRIF